jgi:hypothetical protein
MAYLGPACSSQVASCRWQHRQAWSSTYPSSSLRHRQAQRTWTCTLNSDSCLPSYWAPANWQHCQRFMDHQISSRQTWSKIGEARAVRHGASGAQLQARVLTGPKARLVLRTAVDRREGRYYFVVEQRHSEARACNVLRGQRNRR